jgi:hypothetical protein
MSSLRSLVLGSASPRRTEYLVPSTEPGVFLQVARGLLSVAAVQVPSTKYQIPSTGEDAR